MRTRKGIKDTLVGILIGKLPEQDSDKLAEVADYILDFFIQEENLIIPHDNSLSDILIDFEKYLKSTPKPDEDGEHIINFLVTQSVKVRKTLHPVGSIQVGEGTDVCLKCRYKGKCEEVPGVDERCVNELGSHEYYKED